jgi:imidazolonepropionase-like amidohydrolase
VWTSYGKEDSICSELLLTKQSGSDTAAGAPGLGFGITLHEELYLFVTKVGFTPLEALRAATSLTARKFGYADRGCVAPGYKADLLLVEGNPVEDIRDTLNIRDVWRDGVRTSFSAP